MSDNGFIQTGPVERNVALSGNFLASFITQVYGWMAFGLFVTAIVALFLSNRIVSDPELAETLSGLIFPLFLVELVIVWVISARTGKASVPESGTLFILYSISNGVFFSIVLSAFGYDVAGLAFLATFLTFGVMAIYGAVAKQDLTKWGNIAFMFLIAGIIGSVLNFFLGSETLYWVITYGLLIVFVILVAYNTQKLKSMAAHAEATNTPVSKYAVSGALTLYLDFINLFILILRIFGGSRD